MIFMDEGEVVEEGEPRSMFADPQHPRTKSFLSRVL
jgi:ABC-type polar amino acid transport system ATPase subunit